MRPRSGLSRTHRPAPSGRRPATARWVLERVRDLTGREGAEPPRLVRDTTDFMAVDHGDVVALGRERYLVTGTERERRFTLEDEPKFWVKRALDLRTGRRTILKMVFQEAFRARVGGREFVCQRSAEKEARVLRLVRGDLRFMQGLAVRDSRRNLVRVLDFIEGQDLITHIDALAMSHEAYVQVALPGLTALTVEALEAIGRLHAEGLCHGDIRNDHILVDATSGRFRWIDFDLTESSLEFDLLSLGNVLHFVAGKGFTTFAEALAARPELSGSFDDEDASVFFTHRVMNLRKVFPHLPRRLNAVLMRFSAGARVRYSSVGQIIEDLGDCAAAMGWPTRPPAAPGSSLPGR
ncbi:MAG: lipopolysaccharide kinase InaA family protein [Acidobacteriota bacterium]